MSTLCVFIDEALRETWDPSRSNVTRLPPHHSIQKTVSTTSIPQRRFQIYGSLRGSSITFLSDHASVNTPIATTSLTSAKYANPLVASFQRCERAAAAAGRVDRKVHRLRARPVTFPHD